MIEEDKKGNIIWRDGKRPLRKSYADKYEGKPIGSLWIDLDYAKKGERTGYRTQKPLSLLERIIECSCPETGVVLDPFCGCTTACVATEKINIEKKLNRKWIGIDISTLAGQLLRQRLKDELNLSKNLGIIRMDLPIKNAPKPSKDIKHILYGKQEGCCNGCNIHFQIENLTIDHIIPRAKGGQDTNKNLQLLCQRCNSIKGDRPMEYLKSQLNIKEKKTQNFYMNF